MQKLFKSSQSALGIARALRHGTLTTATTSRALVSAQVRQESAIRAWSWFDPRQVEAEYLAVQAGRDLPLLGVPVGVKDVIDVAGMPTALGLAGFTPAPADRDATCVALLRAAGAVPVGKTVTAEHAYAHPGPTRNPHALDRTPGGSSSGSAAAVGAGVVPLALGTQTGGSVIRPAAYCGVVGVKTSLGALSLDGVAPVAGSLDCLGWFARSTEDAVQAARALLPGLTLATPDTWRVMLVDAEPLGPLEPQALRTLHAAAQAMRDAGHEVVAVSMQECLPALARCHRQIMLYELARSLSPQSYLRTQPLSDVLRGAIRDGLAIDDTTYRNALARANAERQVFEQAIAGFDFILTPSAAGIAPTGLASTGESTFNRIWSVLGWPAVHLPTAWSIEGLPLGVQLVGRHGSDGPLLAAAAAAHPFLDSREEPPGS
ncbi:amidase [Achromobacter sp. Root170]|uniref:amidase n=1 Tax=Achromobacter sp. Root170 TaxID=1736480 RepID=UPI0009E78424|nr:amidase [Achromobacter sp. Root170]